MSKNTRTPTLRQHYLRDFSMEMPTPPLSQPPAPGEQELQFTISLHHVATPTPGEYELLLASRMVIWYTPAQRPLLVADHAYAGIFDIEGAKGTALAEKLQKDCAEALYPIAIDALKKHLELVGHKPPLPKSLDLDKITKKP